MNELEEKLKDLLDDFVSEVGGFAKEDLQRFGKDLARDFATYLYKSHATDDAMAKENVRDLRVKAGNLLTKHALHISREARVRLMAAIQIIAQIALQALRINLPIP